MISELARKLTTSKTMAQSTVRLQPGSFKVHGGFTNTKTNARERRLTVSFKTANVPVVVFHGLGFAPSGFTPLGNKAGTGAGGVIYNDFPLPSTSRVIVLKCSVANTVADILVR